MKTFGKAIMATLGTIVGIILVFIIIAVVNQSKDSKVPTPTVTTVIPVTTTEMVTPSESDQPKKITLVDNEYLSLSYEEMYETGDAMNLFCMVVYATNNINQDIWLLFKDATINDEMVDIVCGQKILPGKSGRFICTINPNQLSIDTIKLVKNMEFSVCIIDEHRKDIFEPQKVKLEF